MRCDRILIVDDDLEIALLSGELLSDDGYDIMLAASVPAALRALAGGAFDLAVVDLLLPGGSGEEVAGTAIAKGVPVLLTSGALDGMEAAAALGIGFLANPFRLDDLLGAVCAALASAAVPAPAIAA